MSLFNFKSKEKTEEAPKPAGWLSRLREGLSKSTNKLAEGIAAVLTHKKLDDESIQEIEDALLMADLGPTVAGKLRDELQKLKFQPEISVPQVKQVMAEQLAKMLEPYAKSLEINGQNRPHVVMMVGVNGTGKTTTIGKLGAQYARDGKKVLIAAGDTFRAAAISQLTVWAERAGCEIVAGEQGGDAASLCYLALEKAKAEQADVLLIDTAGRLHNRDDLMAELAKIVRVIKKLDSAAPHSVVLVLDATTGQNALQQLEIFSKLVQVTGIILTKLDGTAKGGILFALTDKFKIPVHAVGVGEGQEDLRPFAAKDFAAALLGADTAF